ncbi:hypothetical protein HDU67_009981 [Dinochytrium kinnereticum]|nr:hypothetical protein HDU67_009981 [Dinochytrium kinnereticum]
MRLPCAGALLALLTLLASPSTITSVNALCSAIEPCPDGSCCSSSGYCGFTLDHCGTGCQSNCDAKPPQTDCGVNGKETLCPNGACCSSSGYCGFTLDHCGTGCQSNCDAKPPQTDCGVNGKDTLCPNGACCSSSGYCGFTLDYCGTGCQSNCDAKPPATECGVDALPGKTFCPLNACCSQYGYCGFGKDFCSAGCQSNCEDLPTVPKPSCGGSTLDRVIGYYTNWAFARTNSSGCETILPNMLPENINASDYTHLFYAFGGADPVTFELTKSPTLWPNSSQLADDVLIPRLNALKKVNPKLKTLWSIGGWSFNDPGPTERTFSELSRTPESRAKFIQSVLKSIPELGFDGIDLDWEYPGTERGGIPEDGQNYLLLLKELKEAIQGSYSNMVVTLTAPAGYWFLKQFPISEIQKHVDWINIMSYGRTFTLTNATCTTPGCPFADPGKAGECTNDRGFMSYPEIQHFAATSKVEPTLDATAQTMQLVVGDQWITYDTPATITEKMKFARDSCAAGVLIWAVDLDTSGELIAAVTAQMVTNSSKEAGRLLQKDD